MVGDVLRQAAIIVGGLALAVVGGALMVWAMLTAGGCAESESHPSAQTGAPACLTEQAIPVRIQHDGCSAVQGWVIGDSNAVIIEEAISAVPTPPGACVVLTSVHPKAGRRGSGTLYSAFCPATVLPELVLLLRVKPWRSTTLSHETFVGANMAGEKCAIHPFTVEVMCE